MIGLVTNVILISITVYVVVVGLLSFWFMLRMRLILRQQREGSEILGQMVSSIFESINEKEKSIVDLIYRTDLLEATVRRQKSTGEYESLQPAVSIRDFAKRDVMSNITREGSISETEFILLNSLTEGSRKVSDITRSMGKSREHTSRMLGKLLRKGLLERVNTGRSVVYALTDAGRELVM